MIAPRNPTPPLTSPCKGEVAREAGGRGSRFARTRTMTTSARALRATLTDAETLLWKKLRRNNLGFSFRRQHPIGPYVLDFYCASAKLAIELDGGQHAEARHAARDRRRDAYFRDRGTVTIRIWNNDVMANMDGVLQHIHDVLMTRQTPSRREVRADLPLAGGGEEVSSR